ncbi:ADAM 17-like protease isoform X2 [Palaemon carinicauda]
MFDDVKKVEFSALGRDFRLTLFPRHGLLHPEFQAYSVDGTGNEEAIDINLENFYEGHVDGEFSSDVSAHMEDGVMTATITTPEDVFYVEPSWRHISDTKNESMIAYRGSDVRHSWEDQPQNFTRQKICDYVREGNEVLENDEPEDLIESNDTDIFPEEIFNEGPKSRVRRQQADDTDGAPVKSRCSLLLIADYHFFREMGGSNYKATVNYIISLIDRVDRIFQNTVWMDSGEKGGFSDMGFIVKKILVHQEPTPVTSNQLHYNMEADRWDVRKLLEVFSQERSHKKYCLAHLFTDIRFDGGILGLAYVGSPRPTSVGGVCTNDYFKEGRKLYLNSGLSSSRNHYNKKVVTREAELVATHEFGHNWGSEHDPDNPECSPRSKNGGSYVMYTYSVSGYDVNNNKFSPCSLRSIRKVLLAKSPRCFIQPQESYCGNQRVEGDEECDAGLEGLDNIDRCCDKNCKLRFGASCSDRNSPCCHNCQFMSQGVKCREEQPTLCKNEARCVGTKAECPTPKPMEDGTPCIEKGQCLQGRCLPFCETLGKQSCMCDTVVNACQRCCRKASNETCEPVDAEDILQNGTPCFQGFCNEGKCEKVVQDFVERLWSIIEKANIDTVLTMIKDNIVGTVLIISVIIWIPASFIFSYIDHRRREEFRKECERYREFAERWQRASQRHGFPKPSRKPGFGDVVDEATKHLLHQATVH